MRCLEKDRTRRYESASGLARDVQRALADEPVEACPPSASYRLQKLARRYEKALAVVAAFAVLLVAGLVVSTLLALRARQAELGAYNEQFETDPLSVFRAKLQNLAASFRPEFAVQQMLQGLVRPGNLECRGLSFFPAASSGLASTSGIRRPGPVTRPPAAGEECEGYGEV